MNSKSLLLACVASLGMVTLAGAATYLAGPAPTPPRPIVDKVYMTGSTAARAATFTSLTAAGSGSVFDAASDIYAIGISSAGVKHTPAASGDTYMNIEGSINGVWTMIKCKWSGSEGGIKDIATGGSQAFLTDDGTATTDNQVVDLAAADTDKQFSKNPSAAITGTKVAIIPFKWLAQFGSAATLTGVTDAAIRQAFRGNAKLYLFTGNPADTTTRVFVSGRDSDSGTRVNTFGDSFWGINSAPKQVQVAADGSMIDQDPATSGNQLLGDYGYSSGGNLVTQLKADLQQPTSIDIAPAAPAGNPHFSVIAYAGFSDAATALAVAPGPGVGPARELTYNGVAYSIAAITSGQYSFFGNEYIYKKNSPTPAANNVWTKLTAATGVAAFADDTTLIKLSSMKAVRNGPTTDPF